MVSAYLPGLFRISFFKIKRHLLKIGYIIEKKEQADMHKALFREKEALEDVRLQAQIELDSAPEGRLIIAHSHGSIQYYVRMRGERRRYLGKSSPLIQKLAQKDYAAKVLRVSKAEQRRIAQLLDVWSAHLGEHVAFGETAAQPEVRCLLSDGVRPLQLTPRAKLLSVKQVYESLSEERKCLVEPFVQSDEDYAHAWVNAPFEKASNQSGCIFTTVKGKMVRSKSEVIIANRLDELGIPYRYEQPLLVGGVGPLHPDFIILNKRNGCEVIWEHLGMMDDPSYCERALKRLKLYASSGVSIGSGLIVTLESSAAPLDSVLIDAAIKSALRGKNAGLPVA